MEELSLITLIANASFVVKLVMIILLFLSILSWGIIFLKYRQIKKLNKLDHMFEEAFQVSSDFEKLANKFSNLSNRSLKINIFLTANNTLKNLKDNHQSQSEITQKLEQQTFLCLDENTDNIQKHISVLATIGSVSPYIGLFGTVWGIMNAFIGLSSVQQTTIATVAPGIAEALVATAIGLFAAIPALVAYNFLLENVQQMINKSEQFIQRLSNMIKPSNS